MGEVLVFAAAEAVPGHDDGGAEAAAVIPGGQRLALARA